MHESEISLEISWHSGENGSQENLLILMKRKSRWPRCVCPFILPPINLKKGGGVSYDLKYSNWQGWRGKDVHDGRE